MYLLPLSGVWVGSSVTMYYINLIQYTLYILVQGKEKHIIENYLQIRIREYHLKTYLIIKINTSINEYFEKSSKQ